MFDMFFSHLLTCALEAFFLTCAIVQSHINCVSQVSNHLYLKKYIPTSSSPSPDGLPCLTSARWYMVATKLWYVTQDSHSRLVFALQRSRRYFSTTGFNQAIHCHVSFRRRWRKISMAAAISNGNWVANFQMGAPPDLTWPPWFMKFTQT